LAYVTVSNECQSPTLTILFHITSSLLFNLEYILLDCNGVVLTGAVTNVGLWESYPGWVGESQLLSQWLPLWYVTNTVYL